VQDAKTIPQNMVIHFATALNLSIEHFCKVERMKDTISCSVNQNRNSGCNHKCIQ